MGSVAEQLDRRNTASSTAAHAIIDRHHLRHRRHRDAAADEPGAHSTADQRDEHERNIDEEMRPGGRLHIEDIEKARQHGGDHPEARDPDAGWCRHRRGHALEAEEKKEGRGKIDDADNQRGHGGEHGSALSSSSDDGCGRGRDAVWPPHRWS
jgi:hypothetical protein